MVNVLKFSTIYSIPLSAKFFFFFFFYMFHKVLGGMANCVNPDQIAPDLGLHHLHMPFSQENWSMHF